MFAGRVGGDKFIGVMLDGVVADVQKRIDMLEQATRNHVVACQGENVIRISYAHGFA